MRGALRTRLAAAALSALLLILPGCQDQPPTDSTQTPSPTDTAASPQPTPVSSSPFALPCYPEAGFHPINGANRVNLELAGLLYDGLYEVDQNFTAQPALAVSHTVSADSATWTIALRTGVTFSDGSPLTAQDVVYSLNLARQSTLYQYRLSSINSVTAGDNTVTITLSLPNGALDTLLDVPIIKESAAVPPGTGPYVMQGSGDNLSLQRRDTSWRSASHLPENILLRSISGNDALISSFDTGDITLVSADLTGTNTPGFSGNYETTDYPTSNLLFVGFNTASGPCRDAQVRRALSYGMDRSTLVQAILAHHATPTPLPLHPNSSYYDTDLAVQLSYAPQTMAQLLEEGGWQREGGGTYTKGRETLELTLLVSQDNAYRCDVAAELERQLESAGVAVTVDQRPWEEYLSALSSGDFDLYLGETRLTADFTLTSLLPGGSLNYGKFNDWTVTSLHAAFRSAQGQARGQAATAFYEALAEQMPFTALCFKNWSVLSQWGQIGALTPTQENLFYGFSNWELHTGA